MKESLNIDRLGEQIGISLGLEDKVILVTGGNRGIGAAIVSLLEKLGSKVAYTHRSARNTSSGNPSRRD